MKLNQTLSEKVITKWVHGFAEQFPDTDVDQLLGQVLDDYSHQDFDSPSDFMENIVKDRFPDLFDWWSRKDQKDYQLRAEEEHYEEIERQERSHGLSKLIDSKPEVEESIADGVVRVCEKNVLYFDLLSEVADREDAVLEKFGGFHEEGFPARPFGWEVKDIEGLQPGHVSYLIKIGIVADPEVKGYKSNRYRHYQLESLDETREGLKRFAEIQKEKEAQDKLWSKGGFLQGIEVTEEDVERFKTILQENDAIEYWHPAIAPKIVGMREQKIAILISCGSTEDKYENKNRVHTLLYGKPETGKSKVDNVIVKLGGGKASLRSSQVGLTADCSGLDMTLGTLPRNHKGACFIDELDKFSGQDQSGCLDAMEEGEIPIAVGKIQTILPAQTIVVATANDVEKIKPELLSRFDFVVKCDLPSMREAQEISDDMWEYWNLPKGVETLELAKFLKWVRTRDPELPNAVRQKAKDISRQYIMYSRETRPRRLERIIRIALAIARLNYRDCSIQDVNRALEFINEIKPQVSET